MVPHSQSSEVQAPYLAFKAVHYLDPVNLSSLISYRPAWPSLEPWVPSMTKLPFTTFFSRSQESESPGSLVKILIVGPIHRISDLSLKGSGGRWFPRISISYKFPGDLIQVFKGPHFDRRCLYNYMIQLRHLYKGWPIISVCLGQKACSRKPLSPRKTGKVGYPTSLTMFPRLHMGYLLLRSSSPTL